MPSLDARTFQNLEVALWDKSIRRLGEFWEHEPLVLVFLRHYG
jgi:hypothetical protein